MQNFNKSRAPPRPNRSHLLGGVDHTEPTKKKGFARKIVLATCLIVLCIFMLKQSQIFRTPSPFSRQETGVTHVLVTGGAGYIGSHATLRLLKDSYRVTIVDNLSRGNIGAVKVLQDLFPEPGRLQFIYADLGDAKAVNKIFSENAFDAVMHFAAVAYVGESTLDPLKYYHNITSNTLVVLEAMAAHNVNTLIYSSTCATYGEPEKMPITEETPQNPINPYGKAKKMSEDIIQDFHKNSDMAVMILRYFNVIGSDPEGRLGEAPRPELREHGRISGACFDAARGITNGLKVRGTDYKTADGTCIRDYIDVTDLVDAHVKALENAKPGHVGIYNVGTGKGRSVKEFVEACKKATGVSIKVDYLPRRPGDYAEVFSDPSKILRELNWSAQFTDLEKSLQVAWKWQKKMEQDLKWWLKIVLILLIVMVFGFKIFVLLWWKPRKIEEHFAKQGIRGPPYCFFIGNAKELVSLMVKASSKPMPFSHNILPRVLSFYHQWKKIYGPTFLVWFGPTVRLTVAEPDLIREIFSSKSEFYEKNEAHPLIKQLEGDGLLSLKGEKWALHRKIITPTFHMENLKLLIPMATSSVVRMLGKWLDMSNSDEVEIEVSQWYQNLTEETVTRTAFGSSYEDGKHIFQLQAQQMVLASEAFQKVTIPGYRFLPTKRNRESWRLEREIKKCLMKVIERRRENWDNEVMQNGPKDLLGLMIQASTKKESVNYSPAMAPAITTRDIAEECKSFFFAGEQTTSNMLTWTTVLLAMHPQWQVMARDEVLKVCGPRDIPTKDDVTKLKTLTMILNESLRLYPPIVASIRRAKADVQLGGCKVPRGTELLIPILAVHHDQSIWGNDANEFNPA